MSAPKRDDAPVDPRVVIIEAQAKERSQFDSLAPRQVVNAPVTSALSLGLAMLTAPAVEAALVLAEDPSFALAPLPTVEAAAPTAGALLAMSPIDRKAAVHVVLSSTQGRQSLLRMLEQDLYTKLQAQRPDLRSRVRDPHRSVTVRGYGEYRVSILGGRGTIQSAFDFLRVASLCLFADLAAAPDAAFLEVGTLDSVDARSVGWYARLVDDVTDVHLEMLPAPVDPD